MKNMICNVGECHLESKNSAGRARGFWNHTRHLWPGLFGRHNSSLSRVLLDRPRGSGVIALREIGN
jgi:hypothetical protein